MRQAFEAWAAEAAAQHTQTSSVCWKLLKTSRKKLCRVFASAGKPCQRGEMICCEAPLWEHQRRTFKTISHTHTRSHKHTLHKHTYTEEKVIFSRAEQPPDTSSPQSAAFFCLCKTLVEECGSGRDDTSLTSPLPCNPVPQKGERPDRRTTPSHRSLIAKTLTEIIDIFKTPRASLGLHPCIKVTFHTISKVLKKSAMQNRL